MSTWRAKSEAIATLPS